MCTDDSNICFQGKFLNLFIFLLSFFKKKNRCVYSSVKSNENYMQFSDSRAKLFPFFWKKKKKKSEMCGMHVFTLMS